VTESTPLLDSLRALRRRWRLLVLLPAIVTGVALAVSLSSDKQYDARVDVLLQDEQPANALLDPGASTSSSDPQRDLTTNVDLIKIPSTADQVRRRLGLHTSTNDLLDQIHTETTNDSNVVSIVARDPSPQTAARIANAFAAAYVQFRLDSARRRYTEAAQLAQRQLAALAPDQRNSAEARDLQSRERELEIAAALQTGGAEIVRTADVPTSAARPRPALSAVLGLLGGLVLAVFTGLGLELVDRRLKDETAVEEFFGLPVIAAIPRPSRRGGTLDHHVGTEAYGLLAANLSLAGPRADGRGRRGGGARGGQGERVLMITSPSPGDGKTSVTFGVAGAYARLGLRVIVIEADLRRPAFERFIDVSRSRGLAAVLDGSADLEDELVWLDAGPTPARNGDRDDHLVAALPAGELPMSPQRVLSQRRMRTVVESARGLADVVIIDTAPVGTVNDATTILNLVDDVVLVARLNHTTKDAARRALRLLRNVNVQLLGVVVTDAEMTERYGYYPSIADHPEIPAPSPVATEEQHY
jgi:capsular exopolysaccharide synthesis family protein